MSSGKKRVLVVDDDNELVESLRAALASGGYEVTVAYDGAQALAGVERDRPDVMLLDLVMPRRSGISVLQRMRHGGMVDTRVIMMTATNEERHRATAASWGATAFLAKPFAVEMLLAEVETALRA